MIQFTFQNSVITFLFVILMIDSTILIFILYSGQAVVNSISHKLDVLHDQSQIQINAQGNLSQHTRDVLIKEFAGVADKGGFATESGQEAIANNISALLHGSGQPTLAAKFAMQNQAILKDILGNLTSRGPTH